MILRSLTARLALFTAAWVACGLVAAWLLVSNLAASYIEGTFDDRLAGLLDAVVAGTDLGDDARPVLARPVSEPRFDQPLSGVYWQISVPGGQVATSRSLWDQTLPPAPTAQPGVRLHSVHGPAGQHLRIAERDIALPENGARLQVRVAVAHDQTYVEIARLRRGLAVGLALLGAGLVAGTVAEVSLVLAPLRRLRRAVALLRDGTIDRLRIKAGAEVSPLIAEIDALVAQNRATVERARSHIGNLAHALRTNLAVLRNALEAPGGPDLELARRQAEAADELVAHHLARARAAALMGTAAEEVPVLEVAAEVASALRRLFAARGLDIAVVGEPRLRVRCERQDLSEMLGNLIENACKWAKSGVTVTIASAPPRVRVEVADDGPGMPAEDMPLALERGVRLDQAAPGSGLGLAIVADLAALYGGALELDARPAGGLKACLLLPAGRMAAASRI